MSLLKIDTAQSGLELDAQRGRYTIASGIIRVHSSWKTVKSAMAGSSQRSVINNYGDAILTSEGPIDLPEQTRSAFLTREHELHHHHLLTSTPAGMLAWRITNTLVSNIDYLAKTIAKTKSAEQATLPLHYWYATEGHELVKREVSQSAGAL